MISKDSFLNKESNVLVARKRGNPGQNYHHNVKKLKNNPYEMVQKSLKSDEK